MAVYIFTTIKHIIGIFNGFIFGDLFSIGSEFNAFMVNINNPFSYLLFLLAQAAQLKRCWVRQGDRAPHSRPNNY